jgi:hypothetical protein
MTMPGNGAPTPSLARALTLVPALLVAVLAMTGSAAAQDSASVEALQRQNEELQRQVDELRAQMQEIRQMLPTALPAGERPVAPPAGGLALPPAGPTELPPPVLVDGNPVVTSGNERVTLAISGQVNRAMNLANDGSSTQTYYVDNDASNSRIRFVGTGMVTEDFSLGSKIEVAIAPNESSEVSQNNEDSGTFFDERVVEVWGQSEEFGKLALGKGSTASDNTAEVDLSGTDVIMYASIADPVGGLQFRTKEGDLTGVAVNDAFTDFDGLSRKNRLRYDTPSLGGFSLAVSTITNGQYDAGLFWAAEVGGFKAAAAAALAKPSTDDVDYRADASASILHVASGLNLTASTGFDESDDGGNPSSYYLKVGWIADFFDFGTTNFGVDVNRSVNNPTPSDSGWSVGGAVVQNVADFGLQLYSQVRYYVLDRNNDPSVDGITAFTVGTRIKF